MGCGNLLEILEGSQQRLIALALSTRKFSNSTLLQHTHAHHTLCLPFVPNRHFFGAMQAKFSECKITHLSCKIISESGNEDLDVTLPIPVGSKAIFRSSL